jgi:uncharacterized protein
MSRIVFESERPIVQADPARADVACFVGLVRCLKNVTISPAINDWLNLQGWVQGPYARPLSPIFDIPIPIENYTAFTALFDAGGSDASFGTDYLAAAIRTFFAQGGRRCYIVRMGDPVAPTDTANARQLTLQSLLPSTDDEVDDQRGWHGASHLAGLPDVSFLAMPDLPVLCASAPAGAVGVTPVTPSGPAQFEECSTSVSEATLPPEYPSAAPRLLPGDYALWAAAVKSVLEYLSQGNLREMQLVAAFPMPQDTGVTASQENPSESLTQDIHDVINAVMPEPDPALGQAGLDIGISSAFLQLAYPWLKTSGWRSGGNTRSKRPHSRDLYQRGQDSTVGNLRRVNNFTRGRNHCARCGAHVGRQLDQAADFTHEFVRSDARGSLASVGRDDVCGRKLSSRTHSSIGSGDSSGRAHARRADCL